MKKGQKSTERSECEIDSEPVGTKEERDAAIEEALDGVAKAMAKSLKKEITKVDPVHLKVEPHDIQSAVTPDVWKGFVLTFNGNPLKFANGNMAMHELETFWFHAIEEFKTFGVIEIDDDNCYVGPNVISAFKILELQRTTFDWGGVHFVEHFRDYIAYDPIIRRCAGPEVCDQIARWMPALEWLGEHEILLPNHSQVPLESSSEKDVFTTDEDRKFVDFLHGQFWKLENPQKAVVYFLFSGHNAVVFPIILSKFLCTPNEYANGVMASEVLLTTFGDLDSEEHLKISRDFREDAQTASNYIRAYYGVGTGGEGTVDLSHLHTRDRDAMNRGRSSLLNELEEAKRKKILGYIKTLGGGEDCTYDSIRELLGDAKKRVTQETAQEFLRRNGIYRNGMVPTSGSCGSNTFDTLQVAEAHYAERSNYKR